MATWGPSSPSFSCLACLLLAMWLTRAVDFVLQAFLPVQPAQHLLLRTLQLFPVTKHAGPSACQGAPRDYRTNVRRCVTRCVTLGKFILSRQSSQQCWTRATVIDGLGGFWVVGTSRRWTSQRSNTEQSSRQGRGEREREEGRGGRWEWRGEEEERGEGTWNEYQAPTERCMNQRCVVYEFVISMDFLRPTFQLRFVFPLS